MGWRYRYDDSLADSELMSVSGPRTRNEISSNDERTWPLDIESFVLMEEVGMGEYEVISARASILYISRRNGNAR